MNDGKRRELWDHTSELIACIGGLFGSKVEAHTLNPVRVRDVERLQTAALKKRKLAANMAALGSVLGDKEAAERWLQKAEGPADKEKPPI
jgi:hypothetical protein